MPIGEGTRNERDLLAVPTQGTPVASAGSVLDSLPPHCILLHARHWPGRSYDMIDHLAIGPTGIFVVDTVGWTGDVSVTPDLLEVNGRSRLAAVSAAHESAREVALLLSPDVRDHVFPVICFSREESITGWVKAVRVCSTLTITDLLSSRPVVLTADEVTRISHELDAALPSAQAGTGERLRASDQLPPPVTVTSGSAPPGTTWRRTRIGRVAEGSLGLGVVAALAIASLHLTSVRSATDDGPDQHRPGQHQSRP